MPCPKSARGPEPPFPSFRWAAAPPDEIAVSEMILDCNWMQVQEGSIDSSHVGILHLDTLAVTDPRPRAVQFGHGRQAGEAGPDDDHPGRVFRRTAAPRSHRKPPLWCRWLCTRPY